MNTKVNNNGLPNVVLWYWRKFWNKALVPYTDYLILPKEQQNARQVNFCYPITVKASAPFTKKDLTTFLGKNQIETRPIMSGNMAEQPVMKLIRHLKHGKLTNSKIIMRNSFLFGNHQGIGLEERNYIATSYQTLLNIKNGKNNKGG